MKEVGTTHGVYGRLFGVLAWVERVIDGEVLRTGRRGGLGERLLYAGTTRPGPAGQRGEKILPAQQHSSTRGKPPTVSRLADSWETTRSRFPIGKVKADKLANNKERKRETLDDPRMQQAQRLREGPTRLTSQWRASERGWFAVSPAVAVSLDRFATFDPHTSTTSLSDIPLPLNPRRHQLITNLPDTFIIITASRTPICKSRGKNLPDRES
jgi:hypothetical protein